MRKTFSLTHEKIKTPRLVDAIKHEVKKYLKRERNKQLPADADFWDFDCRYGATKETADVIHVSQLNKSIDDAASRELTSFYLEILAKTGHRTAKTTDSDEEQLSE
ncbi:hypothetical protein tinsulaeT_04630 [Thalassotalea insulae]|uniref:Uncharacterized protein n=1 Tax=Thalassotalea insulae TaxID=2056778 RepID=A0ABQ6GM94_9GAMM|nr:DUF6172 family protein [Thalassotalea insulae]GLX77123.1 hypothetical protein tinsulaeT_04630 [Thalassotalea insulae]